MGLRTKLFFPAILGFVLIASTIHFLWVPEHLADQYDHFIQDQVKLLSILEPELANAVVNGDLAALHASLNRQLDLNRPAWLAISLHNSDGLRLFPIDPVGHFSGAYIYSYKHPIIFGDQVVAMLDLALNWQPALDIKLAQIHRIELLILITIGLIGIASMAWHNILFRRPLERLEYAAARLSEGDFSAPLPKQNHDEIGNLARSFAQMRSSLQASQADLSAALLESQNNADKYRLEVKFREALYELQEISLSSTNRQELLDRTLQKLMSLEFLTIEHKGALFLATDEAGVFQRVAKFNLDTALETQTTRVTFTSQTGDEKNPPACEAEQNHQQCNVAIKFAAKTLGFMRLYLPDGHQNSEIEMNFLSSSADILASAINWFDYEDALCKNNVELSRAKYEAECSNRAKGDFLATISHELRTPLNGVLGMAQLLQMTKLDDEQMGYVTTMISSGNSLVTIIDDILDLAKIEAGKLGVEEIVFDLQHSAQEVVQLLLPRAQERGLRLNLHYATNCDRYFLGDPGRIRQILINLVGNAIKFTHHGHVAINISCAPHSRQQSAVRIAITDSGIGIPIDVQRRLFESFTQADTSTTRKYGGTGLGLAICKQLVELMGGAIGVNSTPGEGSTFWFRINLYNRNESDVAPQRVGDSSGDGPLFSGTVLVAEDNVFNQTLLVSMLKKLGLRHEAVDDGSAAIQAWQSGKFDLILMSCQMPGMNGLQATQLIRQHEQQHHIPIVALTTNATEQETLDAKQAGMDDHLNKPFQLEQLVSILERWLPKKT